MFDVANLGKGFRTYHSADGYGICGIKNLAWFKGRQKTIHLFLIGHIHSLVSVGQDKTVYTYHDRHAQSLCNFKGLDMHINRLLIGLCKQLNPSGIPHGHGIGLVIPDIDRRTNRTVAHRHDNR